MKKWKAEEKDRGQAVLKVVNEHRRKHDRKPLKYSRALAMAAHAHAVDMADRDYFGHDTKGGMGWAKRIKKIVGRARFPEVHTILDTIGENVAYGQDTAREVVGDWIDSPGHNENLLRKDFTHMGLGFAKRGSTEFWVQDFGG